MASEKTYVAATAPRTRLRTPKTAICSAATTTETRSTRRARRRAPSSSTSSSENSPNITLRSSSRGSATGSERRASGLSVPIETATAVGTWSMMASADGVLLLLLLLPLLPLLAEVDAMVVVMGIASRARRRLPPRTQSPSPRNQSFNKKTRFCAAPAPTPNGRQALSTTTAHNPASAASAMPSFLERMKAKEELQEKHHAEFERRHAEAEAEEAYQTGERAYVDATAGGDPYHTSIAHLYAAGELQKSQQVEFHVPWLPDKNGVRHRVSVGTVVETPQGEGRIAFDGALYNFPEAFARHALEHAFRSHTFAQEYVPSYEQLLVNGWLHVLYKGLPLLRYRERADVRRRARILGERRVERCHGSEWRRVEQGARPKPDHLFQPERTARADAAEAAAEEAAVEKASGKEGAAAKKKGKAAKMKLAKRKGQMSPEEEAAAALEEEEEQQKEQAEAEAEAAAAAAAEAAAAAAERERRAREYDYKARPHDAYFYNNVSKRIVEAPLLPEAAINPRCFRHVVPSAAAAAVLERSLKSGGKKGAALLRQYAELEAAAGAAGWAEWDGAQARGWVDAHLRATPLERRTAQALTRTRTAEACLATHRREGTYIAPAAMPMVGLPPGDPMLAAPWATAEAGADSAAIANLYSPAVTPAPSRMPSPRSDPSSGATGGGNAQGGGGGAQGGGGGGGSSGAAAAEGGSKQPRHDAEATHAFYASVKADEASRQAEL